MRKRNVVIHTEREIAGIREACAATAHVRDELCASVRPGISTRQIDDLARGLIAQVGGTSAFLGYRGFPGQICISLNDEVVHGIGRADRVIQCGDLVSLDVGVKLNGFIGDTARTVAVPPPSSPVAASLMHATQESLEAGIAAACGGCYVNDISRAVERVILDAGFTAVRDFVGHGCGCALHEPPEVPNFAQRDRGPKLRAGMVLAIEPMVNAGGHQVRVEEDGWTVRTADHSLSAHFEHMVLITNGKPEILTCPKTA
ncbi:MAG: type I methionyl aminopeptidase [Lentisphaerae bacterium]|jgi:methionyl aminopeptidase|nr:type I methionyl aminopeptidase [Lentisphaerota bacterium]MBT4819526.1 type I methionyl aminopeptidase [Lentisphaerota bacterium]MBT5608275.1 type I methionyl aminopeptidase [Lentisphaerota bacterium]MBT7061825.1 type I methionyl aminopeptidase [Lentisphaerota bacterium]MBT7846134.1 type I methionyl aminopeptidase [Lentisphaerota bacterium]